MNLNLNYEYFLIERKYKVVSNLKTRLDVRRCEKHHINRKSLEEVCLPKTKTEVKTNDKLLIPSIPIIDSTSLKDQKDVIVPVKEEQKEEVKEENVTEEPFEQYDESKYVALTFNDGPSKYTDDLLSILDLSNSKATFFISGNKVRGNEEIIKKIVSQGHQIGNHGYSHTPFTKLSYEDLNTEIVATNSVLKAAGVEPAKIVRPPYGQLRATIKDEIQYPLVLWNIDSNDSNTHDKEQIKNNIRKNIQEGSIILMHDMYPSTLDAVREIIPELNEQGYKFTTFDEMQKKYSIKAQKHHVYAMVKENN